jgi:hypothetical protein
LRAIRIRASDAGWLHGWDANDLDVDAVRAEDPARNSSW